MATENTVSKPLYDDEEEKRKRKVAEDYLKNRSAFMDSQRKDFTVDVPEDVAAPLTDEQLKAEGTRRIGEIKTNFQNSFKAANEAGFKNAQAAEDYLNRGQARVVGDTLVGSAAGIRAGDWEKRDQAAMSGSPIPLPRPDLSVEKSLVGGGVVRMDSDTAKQIAATQERIATTSAPYGPAITPEAAAKNYLSNLTKSRANDQAYSIERYNNFRQGVDNEGDTMASFRNQRKDDQIISERAKAERRLAQQSYRDAKEYRRGILQAARRGSVEKPDAITKANQQVSEAQKRLGYGLDTKSQLRYFEKDIRNRINPFDTI